MIVSMAMAVFPVWRSPDDQLTLALPIGIIASMALMPVCNAWFTGWRKMNARRFPFQRHRESFAFNATLAVEWLPDRIDDPSE